jgi:hypothetical protein
MVATEGKNTAIYAKIHGVSKLAQSAPAFTRSLHLLQKVDDTGTAELAIKTRVRTTNTTNTQVLSIL